jgi:cysteinyl-tRNA synthetase
MIRLYNTLSGENEPLPAPDEQKKIRMFVCGPTVYDYLHIGNARTYIFFDFFANYLRSQGYDVHYVQNITDIDDKIIKRAAEENKEAAALADFFEKAYFEDVQRLHIADGITYAPATQFITQIVAQVERLIDKGFAYEIDGDGWYFDIAKDEDYGKLSHRTTEQAEDGTTRIDEAIGKRNKGDFCLWKFSKSDAAVTREPSWTTSLGAGRPGWHIEDTAISEFYFGPQYEIHGGGVDLKFPHHEAEIAQQESASGLVPFVRTWMHVGALLVGGKKMSKSAGNFITIRDFFRQYPPEVLRWITLTHHYRSPIDFSTESAQQAAASIDTVHQFIAKLAWIAADNAATDSDSDMPVALAEIDTAFAEALADDVRTELAIAHLFDAITAIHQKNIWQLSPAAASAVKENFTEKLELFGIPLKIPEIHPKAEKLAAERELSRADKQFKQSDALRKEINALGYDIEDTPKGPFLWPHPNQQN